MKSTLLALLLCCALGCSSARIASSGLPFGAYPLGTKACPVHQCALKRGKFFLTADRECIVFEDDYLECEKCQELEE